MTLVCQLLCFLPQQGFRFQKFENAVWGAFPILKTGNRPGGESCGLEFGFVLSS